MAEAMQCAHRFKLAGQLPLKKEHRLKKIAQSDPLIEDIHVSGRGGIIEFFVKSDVESEGIDRRLKGFLSSNGVSFLYQFPARKAA